MTGPRKHHAVYLGMALAAILGSFALEDTAGLTFLGFPLPPLCPLKAATGLDCPGCGLTRSFVALAHGRVEDSFACHHLGVALFLLAAYQLWYRPWMMHRDEYAPPPALRRVHAVVCYGLIAGLVANWLVQVVRR